jgi:hypothetical protein
MLRSMNYCIYALKDPETNEYRYIGLTSKPKARLKAHISTALKNQKYGAVCEKDKWILGLNEKGLQPIFEILFLTSKCLATYWEAITIEYLSLSNQLYNDHYNLQNPYSRTQFQHKLRWRKRLNNFYSTPTIK